MRINIQSARFYASSTLHHLCGCCKNPYTCAGFFVFVGWLINSTRQGSNLRTRCDGVLSPTPLTTRPHVRFLTKFGVIQDIPRGGILSYVPIGAVSLGFQKLENLNCCMDTSYRLESNQLPHSSLWKVAITPRYV